MKGFDEMNMSLALLNWAAWAPGVTSKPDWHAWARGQKNIAQEGQPALEFVPALARRRMSRLTRMAMQAAEDCRGEKRDITTVFASRHGEIHRSFGVLESVVAAEAVSPADFSVSVHNAASGLYGIQQGDRSASTTISAGTETLEAAFAEAYAQLQSGTHELLLVIADELVPSVYSAYIEEEEYPCALALHLAAGIHGGTLISLLKTQMTATHDVLPHSLQLLRLLCGEGDGRCGKWQWGIVHAQ